MTECRPRFTFYVLGRWAAPAMALLVFLLAYFDRVSYAGSDPRFSLLTSQALLEHGEQALNAYAAEVDLAVHVGNQLVAVDGQVYYYFPVGGSLIALPFVALARGLGWDMADAATDAAMQDLLSALICALVFGLLYLTARCYLRQGPSLVIAAVSVLGSSLISTAGTALWSSSWAVLFVSLALYLLARADTGRSVSPMLLGFALFGAYLSRPTTALFAAAVLGLLFYWWWQGADSKRAARRSLFWFTITTLFLLFAGYVAWNWASFGRVLPEYLSTSRLATHRFSPWVALYGHLFSPSRGLLVFSPFLLVVAVEVVREWKRLARRPLFWLAACWPALHLAVVSVPVSNWWGGHAYGPRLLTEVMPGLALLSVLVWQGVGKGWQVAGSRGHVIAFATLGGMAVFMNSCQGLYNGNTARWNGTTLPPDPTIVQHYLFDWRYPQFLASKGSLCARNRAYVMEQGLERLTPVSFGQSLEEEAAFVGWSVPEGGRRFSECNEAAIWFRPAGDKLADSYELVLDLASLASKRVDVFMNGERIGSIDLAGSTASRRYVLQVDGRVLQAGQLNEIRLRIHGAPLIGDPRVVVLEDVIVRAR